MPENLRFRIQYAPSFKVSVVEYKASFEYRLIFLCFRFDVFDLRRFKLDVFFVLLFKTEN